MDKEERKRLQKIIQQGKWNFILIKGMLYWGVSFGVIMILFYKFVIGYEMDVSFANFFMLISLIGGLFVGILSWRSINKKLKNKKE